MEFVATSMTTLNCKLKGVSPKFGHSVDPKQSNGYDEKQKMFKPIDRDFTG